ncbi:hypothetical protein PQX77_002438, partial [Marasmius sp. AFHP31]
MPVNASPKPFLARARGLAAPYLTPPTSPDKGKRGAIEVEAEAKDPGLLASTRAFFEAGANMM